MNYANRIREEWPYRSKSFTRLGSFLLDDFVDAAFMTAAELAHAANVDTATVVRFAQHLGFSGYPDLQQSVQLRVKQFLQQPPAATSSGEESPHVAVQQAIQLSLEILSYTNRLIQQETWDLLIQHLLSARKVFLLSSDLCQIAGLSLQNGLENAGILVQKVANASQNLAQAVISATPEDFFLAIECDHSNSMFANTLKAARQRNIPTCAISTSALTPCAQNAGFFIQTFHTTSFQEKSLAIHGLSFAIGKSLETIKKQNQVNSDGMVNALMKQIQQ